MKPWWASSKLLTKEIRRMRNLGRSLRGISRRKYRRR